MLKKIHTLHVGFAFFVMLVSTKVVADNLPVDSKQQPSADDQKLPSSITFEPATNELLRGLMVIQSDGRLNYQDYAYSDAVNKILSREQQRDILDCLQQTASFWKIPANHNNHVSFYVNQKSALAQKTMEGDFTYHVSDEDTYLVLLPKENADAKKISACFKRLSDPIIASIDRKNRPRKRGSAVSQKK